MANGPLSPEGLHQREQNVQMGKAISGEDKRELNKLEQKQAGLQNELESMQADYRAPEGRFSLRRMLLNHPRVKSASLRRRVRKLGRHEARKHMMTPEERARMEQKIRAKQNEINQVANQINDILLSKSD